MSGVPTNVDWEDEDQVKAAVKKDGYLLRFASAQLKTHDKTVLKAVQRNGSALMYANLTGILRGNRKIALAAVSQDGEALEFVASDLRRDREVELDTVLL